MRIIPYSFVCCCLFAACHPAPSDTAQVTGQATMKVVPDMVELSLNANFVRLGFKMTSEILEFQDVAFAGFAIDE